MGHPGCDDRRHVIMVKHAVELEDVRARHVFPDDRLLTEALFAVKSAHVHVFCSLSAIRTHLLESCSTLLIRCPQDLHGHRFAILRPGVDFCARSGCMRFVGECYCVRVDPVRVREILAVARES